MRTSAREAKLQRIVRIGIFGLSLAFFLGWLAAPESLRQGRNAAASYLHISPESDSQGFATPSMRLEPLPAPAMSGWIVGVEGREVWDANLEIGVMLALLLLAFGFRTPGSLLRSFFGRVSSIDPRRWLPDTLRRTPFAGGGHVRAYGRPAAVLLSLGLFLGWLSAPDFIREHETSFAAGVRTSEPSADGLMDAYSSWTGPVASLTTASHGAWEPAYVIGDMPNAMTTEDLLAAEGDEGEVAEVQFRDLAELSYASMPRDRKTERARSRRSDDAAPGVSDRPESEYASTGFEPAPQRVASGSSWSGLTAGGNTPSGSDSGSSSNALMVSQASRPASDGSSSTPDGGSAPPDGRDGGTDGTGDRGVSGSPLFDVGAVVGELLVSFDPEASDAEVAAVLADVDGEIVECFDVVDYCLVRVAPELDLLSLVTDLVNDPAIAGAVPNYLRYPAGLLDSIDVLYPAQWALNAIGAPGAWSTMGSAKTVKVAVLDTGFDLLHPDLLMVKKQSINAVGGAIGVPDHGTEVTGVLAALGDNAYGIAGVNKKWAELVLVQVFRVGQVRLGGDRLVNLVAASDADIIRGISMLPSDTKVVNMSFSGGPPSDPLCGVIEAKPGMLFVAAAGNDRSSDDKVYPANCGSDNVIAVGSIDIFGGLSSSSNRGSWVDLAAPGEAILTTTPLSSFTVASGTSLAAPHVSGAASLLFAKNSNASPVSVRKTLMDSADRLNGIASSSSGGKLNACRALGGAGC